jgi:cytochrome c oxidase assembly protein subunit 11
MAATRPAGNNTLLAIGLLGVVAGMAGLAYASVPLYRLFCQVTGYGGTTQVAAAAPGASEARMITVRFDATVSPSLPWRFEPTARAVEVAVGEERLAYYRATNLSDRPVTGMATFNVTPHKAGLYFNKIACFCFDRQVLEPGESVEMPVSFYVDPEIAGDPNLDEVKTITLSYTVFLAVGEAAATDRRGLAKLAN